MKKIIPILAAAGIIIMGCDSKHLEKQTAFDVIKKELAYPKILDHDVYCSDPEHARKIKDAGLEKEGLVTVQQARKLSDADKPLIHFTEKAQPYLLPTPEKDKAISVQKIKLADEDIADIISIRNAGDNKAELVEYTTAYKNVTPFAALVNQDFKSTKNHKAYLSMHDGNWEIEKIKGR